MSSPARVRADACPGVFATHDAADGPLARVRLPGGAVSADRLRVLADCAEDLGDGDAHLTSRGNVQLRGVTRPGLATRLTAAGLLPSPTHERVRNVLASPLSGVSGGIADVRGLAGDLDEALCAEAELAELPGRFLFAFDDGRGDVAGEGADVCWRAVTPQAGTVLLAGADTGWSVPREEAVAALLALARAFVAQRATAWRVAELPDPAALLPAGPRTAPVDRPVRVDPTVGPLGDHGLGVAPRFGRLTAAQLRVLAEVADHAVVTPWRSIVLPDAAPDAVARLHAAGLSTDPAVLEITACIGRPGCAKSLADVRADAARLVPNGVRAHVAGCARRCGRPSGDHLDVVAEAGGYRVGGRLLTVSRLAESLVRKENP
ncbi:precorrin-3B synthase [Amycolatopsis rhabdoformis]|uniref:Precorrin-3B synthase n=1 Tax=Amycolatopsis rhabdoformis TaxID=1448059 RepID=A0ABZ1HXG5_9PSEU|nr:precorrin-3B synthase [Amycolatopsis rhabdoformis]WSE26074.1 precorrin-3B synthase [Amycolatopsis rhabdoformis]